MKRCRRVVYNNLLIHAISLKLVIYLYTSLYKQSNNLRILVYSLNFIMYCLSHVKSAYVTTLDLAVVWHGCGRKAGLGLGKGGGR